MRHLKNHRPESNPGNKSGEKITAGRVSVMSHIGLSGALSSRQPSNVDLVLMKWSVTIISAGEAQPTASCQDGHILGGLH